MKWYQKPVRMMRIDYLQELDRLKDLDLEQLAREAKHRWHINCEWIIGTPGVAPGTAQYVTFNSDRFEKYPPLGDFDLVREYLPHARKYGLKVLAYTNMHWFSYAFAKENPGWEQIHLNGEPYGRVNPLYGNGTTLCVNTAWRSWAFELLRELMSTGIDGVFLDGPLVFPGCCYCEDCQRLFTKTYGAQMPKEEDWRHENWRNFIRFREQSLARFLSDARKSIESENSDGVVFLNAGNLNASGWRAARDNSVCAPHQHFNGAEAFYHPGREGFSLHAWSLLAKYLTAESIPAVVFSHHALGSWHYLPLPEYESQISIAQTVANGANPWFAVFVPALDADKEKAIAPIEKLNGFIEEHEKSFTNTQSAATVAVVLSRQTYNFYVSDLEAIYGARGSGVEEGLGVDMGSGNVLGPEEWKQRKSVCESMLDSELKGYCSTLMRYHIPFDIILDKDLTQGRLSQYEVVILPGTACLDRKQKHALVDYIRRGGKSIGSFELGRFDENGNPVNDMTLLEVFGIQELEGAWPIQAFEEYLRVKSGAFADSTDLRQETLLPRPAYCLKTRSKQDASTSCLAVFMNRIGALYTAMKGESEFPALIASEYGKGKTVYFPHLLGESISKFKVKELMELFLGALFSCLGFESPVQTDAPSTVEVELQQQSDKECLLVHLVNMTGDMQRPINSVIPLKNIELSVRAANVQRVRVVGKGELSHKREGQWVRFILPELNVYEVVALDGRR